MEDGTSFLFADDKKEGDRIIIFASEYGRKLLESAETLFIDGTFKSCSKQYRQIYTLHVDIGSTHTEVNIIPVMFALLENQKKATYSRLFSIIKEKLSKWSPKVIKMDFEAAAITSLKTVFPTVQISGCHYHFSQAIWRKIQQLGLVQEYKENAEVRLILRMCVALAYIPLPDIDEGWLIIMENAPQLPKVQEFLDYFVDQWMENPNIQIDMWNIYKQRHRTNNAVEGWNNRLNSTIKQSHPRINDLILCLKAEAAYSDLVAKRKYLNLEGKRRKPNYIRLDERIQRILQEYEATRDLIKCLKTLAYVQKLE
jgi:hypothetical protein